MTTKQRKMTNRSAKAGKDVGDNAATASAEAPADRARMQVLCTREQEDIVTKAAVAAGFKNDRSAWILAHALKGAKADDGSITLIGELAEQVRLAAARQGIKPEQWIRLAVAAA